MLNPTVNFIPHASSKAASRNQNVSRKDAKTQREKDFLVFYDRKPGNKLLKGNVAGSPGERNYIPDIGKAGHKLDQPLKAETKPRMGD